MRILAVFILGGIAGAGAWNMAHYVGGCHPSSVGGHYDYINENFVCGEEAVIDKAAYVKTTNDIVDFIAAEKAKGNIDEMAVFFRDLKSGPTFNVSGNAPFVPASLMKVPVVFGYFRYAEEHPEILKTKIAYSKKNIPRVVVMGQVERPGTPLVEGETYTIEELMRSSMIYSDNLSFYVLVEYFNDHIPGGSAELFRTLQDLGIVDPRSPDEQVVSVRNYASLFRLLYNASFLSLEDSEKVLSWLADSAYTKGLVAGVPDDIEVAHKFGERELTQNGTKQLHDCGIVYYPENPYELCVMTQGDNWGELQGVIRAVSEMVYKEVHSRRL